MHFFAHRADVSECLVKKRAPDDEKLLEKGNGVEKLEDANA